MLATVKWFTQRITGLIVWPFGIFVIPFALTKFLEIIGILGWIDGLYLSDTTRLWVIEHPWFWAALIISRIAFVIAWLRLAEWFVEKGEEYGFFWFKPERSSYTHEESRDKSGEIMLYLLAALFLFVFSEFAIRAILLQVPLYLPPPKP